jgi:hypothetical protein
VQQAHPSVRAAVAAIEVEASVREVLGGGDALCSLVFVEVQKEASIDERFAEQLSRAVVARFSHKKLAARDKLIAGRSHDLLQILLFLLKFPLAIATAATISLPAPKSGERCQDA